MQLRFFAKWFAIGFAARLVFGSIVFLMMVLTNFEAAMWHFVDLPTMACLWLLEQGPGIGVITGGDPFYIPLNLFGGVVWGVLVAVSAWLISTLVRRFRVVGGPSEFSGNHQELR